MAKGFAGKYSLKGPCSSCPFRTDKPFYLSPERAEEITSALTEQDLSFSCHKTVDYTDDGPEVNARARECGGSMVMLEKIDLPNQGMRIAERLGMYDRTRLDMDAPVFDSFEDWVEAMRDRS